MVMESSSGDLFLDSNMEIGEYIICLDGDATYDIFGNHLKVFDEMEFIPPEKYGHYEDSVVDELTYELKDALDNMSDSYTIPLWFVAFFSISERDYNRYKLTKPEFEKFLYDPMPYVKHYSIAEIYGVTDIP